MIQRVVLLLGILYINVAALAVEIVSTNTSNVVIDGFRQYDGVSVFLKYTIFEFPESPSGERRFGKTVEIEAISKVDVYWPINYTVSNSSPSSVVEPIRFDEGSVWGSNLIIATQQDDPRGPGTRFGDPVCEGKAVIFGFKQYLPDGVHFGWARVQGTNGFSHGENYAYNFDTNRPPVVSEVTINPVPWAASILGRPSPGGPKLSFEVLNATTLRLTYPDWGTRYAVRRRNGPKGTVVQTFPSGKNGLVATNGVFVVDVPLETTHAFFELYLPPANRDP